MSTFTPGSEYFERQCSMHNCGSAPRRWRKRKSSTCWSNISLLVLVFFSLLSTVLSDKRKEIVFPSHSEFKEETLIWAVKLDHSKVTPDEVHQKTLSDHDLLFEDLVMQKNKGQHDTKQNADLARKVAKEIKVLYLGPVGEITQLYLMAANVTIADKRMIENDKLNLEKLHKHHEECFRDNLEQQDLERLSIENGLENHENVVYYSRQRIVSRVKRVPKQVLDFPDPYFKRQWHLVNEFDRRMDINVTGVWERNITGVGVTVAVVDDGVEWTNLDIKDNYNAAGSWDLNSDDPDPMPSVKQASNHHGTRCAGEIAAVSNSVCSVGVAYNAKVSGLRILDGPMTDSLEAMGFNKNYQINDIYSCSWGPDDDGRTVDGPHVMANAAMRYGITYGRGGYGNIFVVASGNGGRFGDNCNFDGYANSIYTVTIGAVDDMGHMPYYAEECASMLAVTFSSGSTSARRSIVTTDWTMNGGNGCTEKHSGTSAAAPIAAGMIALMLQARPCLTWRDVQYIIAMTAQKVDVDVAHWQRNKAGLFHSPKHGFGLMKAWRLVNAAKVWQMVPWMTAFVYDSSEINIQIPKLKDHKQANKLEIMHQVSETDIKGYDLYTMEYVYVTVTITLPYRGFLEVYLTCPSGMESVLATPRPHDNSSAGFSDWTFSTVRCWGESPVGKWRLVFKDGDNSHSFGYLKRWKLKIYGSPMLPEEFKERKKSIEKAMGGQYLYDNFSLPCPGPPVTAQPDKPMSEKLLKIVVLIGIFCLIMTIYETFEYACCYNEEKKETLRRHTLTHQAQNALQPRTYESSSHSSETQGLLSEEQEGIQLEDISTNENH